MKIKCKLKLSHQKYTYFLYKQQLLLVDMYEEINALSANRAQK